MHEFTKIDLASVHPEKKHDTISQPLMERGKRKLKVNRKKVLLPVGIIVIIFAACSFLLFAPLKNIYSSAQKTNTQARLTWDAIKKQNIELASTELVKTKKDLEETQKSLSAISFLRYVPIASWYYNDADHLIKAGFHGLDAATILVESVKPYADVLGLKGQGSFVMGSAEDRIRLAVATMGKITPRIDDLTKYAKLAQEEIDQVSPNHYPPFLGGQKIRSQLIQAQKLADEGVGFVDEARPLIKVLPSLLGESKEKKYLVIFQNDSELRPTGGFITAYAVFRVDKGIIHIDRSDDIYTLDKSLRKTRPAPAPIVKYLPEVKTFNLRDSNLSPDYIESMNTFASMYESASGSVNIDGIIALDTNVLVHTIKILDDEIVAGGIKFTTQKEKECDCPQVIWQLEHLISKPKSLDLRVTSLESVQAQRKDILGILLYAIMQKALKSSPKLYWGPLMQEMINQTGQKHILVYVYDKNAQAGVEALNAAGKIKSFDGDYLHINQANLGGAKSNLFVRESVTQNIEVQSDGSLVKTITLNYKNPFPPSDCNLERGNVCLNATLRDWIRVYVPKGSELISSQGSEVKVTSYEELGKTVFDGFLTVRPLGSATYTLKYRLPFKLAKNSPLPLLIQKQPGTYENEYVVKINNKQVEKFPLIVDKELRLHL